MRKLSIDQEKCIGCGNCYGAYDDLFAEDGDKAKPVKTDGFTPEEEKDIEAAILACGAGDAISYEEETAESA